MLRCAQHDRLVDLAVTSDVVYNSAPGGGCSNGREALCPNSSTNSYNYLPFGARSVLGPCGVQESKPQRRVDNRLKTGLIGQTPSSSLCLAAHLLLPWVAEMPQGGL